MGEVELARVVHWHVMVVSNSAFQYIMVILYFTQHFENHDC